MVEGQGCALMQVGVFGVVVDKIQSLFALGSVYSTKASGAEQTTETNNSH